MNDLIPMIVSLLIGFFIGVPTGYFLHKFTQRNQKEKTAMNKSVSDANRIFAYIMLSGYLFIVIVGSFNLQYTIPAPVHGIMGIIAGYLFYNKKSAKTIKEIVKNE